MLKRAYAIKLKPDIEAGARSEFIRALEEAPKHIPGMTISVVRPAIPPSKYDLIWDNAFSHAAFYRNYLSHPYHCNVIDHYMYRESPEAVISDSLCLRWDEDEGRDSSGDTDVTRSDLASLPTVGDHDGPLYLVEQISVLPGKVEAYLNAIDERYRPMLKGFGIREFLRLRSPETGGENEVVFIWELDDWATFVDFRAFFQFDNEPASSQWIDELAGLRSGGRRRLMLPVSAPPS